MRCESTEVSALQQAVENLDGFAIRYDLFLCRAGLAVTRRMRKKSVLITRRSGSVVRLS